VQGILHPVVVTALMANAGAALHGQVIGVSYDMAQKLYYSKVGLLGFCGLGVRVVGTMAWMLLRVSRRGSSTIRQGHLIQRLVLLL
jgi:hypothetical protein